MRKQATKVTTANDGMHSQKAYRKVTAMLGDHGFLNPRLYHLILMDKVEAYSPVRFRTALKALCRRLTEQGIDHHWRACIERDDEKGLHFHVFLLAESKHVDPCRFMNTTKTGWLRTMMDRHVMQFHLSPPKAAIHLTREGKQKNYARPTGDRKADCIEWISYLVKARSKPSDMRTIYFSSRVRRPTAAEPTLALA
jgi:hypothetical protein